MCNNFFNEKRCLKDLFRTKQFYICNACINKYPFEINKSIIPLEHHSLEIISLFEKDRRINYEAFVDEYSLIYKKVCELNCNRFIVFVNKLYLNEETLDDYNCISTLLDKDIIVLTNILLV